MAKNSMKQIQEDERKILHELANNSNKSINEIAKKCGFSRQKVWRIIKGLEKNHTIWGYTTIVDKEKQDLKNYTILIKRTNTPMEKEQIDKIVKRNLERVATSIGVLIESSYYTHGMYDWMISFAAKDTKDAKKLSEALTRLYSENIKEIHLLETLFTAKKHGITNPEMEKLKYFFNGV